MGEDERDELRDQQNANFARANDSPEGFDAFHQVLMGKKLPRHARNWIKKQYQAKVEEKRGVITRAFRGAIKSTVLMLFVLFRTGHRPQGSSLIIRIKDKVGYKMASRMARYIEHSKRWKMVFPDVVPDKPAGWGSTGYEVQSLKWWFKLKMGEDGQPLKGKMLFEQPEKIDPEKHLYTEIDYPDWQRLREEDGADTPTFLGVGINSGEIIGKHPTNCLSLDDIHNRENTDSFRELMNVRDTYVSDILPTIVPGKTWVFWACTPWVSNDTYAMAEASGEYLVIHTPALIKVEKGTPGAVMFRGQWVIEAWPEKYPVKVLLSIFNEIGEKEFARMYWLNLELAKGIRLKRVWLTDFEYDRIKSSWPVVMGLDYASTPDRLKRGQRDYFALAIGRLPPSGGLIVVDGYFDHISQGEALDKVKSVAASYPTLTMIGVEAQGKGEEFLEIMRYNTALPLMQFTASRSKGTRFENEMAVVFQNKRAFISDIHVPFLREFIDEWISWDGDETTGYDDVLDSVYYMCRASIAHLMPLPEQEAYRVTNPLHRNTGRQPDSPAAAWYGRESNG